MGTGTFGGGGGGGGSGGGFARLGGGSLLAAPPSVDELRDHMASALAGVNRSYLEAQFCSPLLRAVFEELFRLSVEVFQNHSWEGVARDFGISDGPGCLAEWVAAVLARHGAEETNEKIRQVALICLEDFAIKALGDDPDLYLSAPAPEVLARLDRKVFDSTSAHFLATLIWRILEREDEALPAALETRVSEVATQVADRVVAGFEAKFYGKGQTTHRDFFRIACENFPWFLKELRS